jgi:hypothetical protein|tara:strand:+ start:966 stop:1178 length:213 start_codon:yes stop_codon:yes gene_type:complete
MQVGDIITLKGITGHGKNRVREQGVQWSVMNDTTDIGIVSRDCASVFPPIRSLQTGEWRWFDNVNFEVVS